ncbi:hypothetical protein G3I17_10505 [Streptomyces sp. SID13031]|nr:hypothetical protein [Streptomyces sp. SID13031]
MDNFDDNALAWFKPFVQAKPGSSLYERGLRMVGDGSQQNDAFAMGAALVKEFGDDVKADRLPQVSWLVAPAALSEHANYAPPNGEHLTAQLLAALADNPAVWAKTAFILNYDEHGGFFDHALPPVPPLATGRGKSTVSPDGEVVVRVSVSRVARWWGTCNKPLTPWPGVSGCGVRRTVLQSLVTVGGEAGCPGGPIR